MGLPEPLSFETRVARYTSEYLVASEKNEHNQIQNMLPTPPSVMHAVTPIILPVPTQPPSAVHKPLKGEIPLRVDLRDPENGARNVRTSLCGLKNPSRAVSIMPHTRSMTEIITSTMVMHMHKKVNLCCIVAGERGLSPCKRG